MDHCIICNFCSVTLINYYSPVSRLQADPARGERAAAAAAAGGHHGSLGRRQVHAAGRAVRVPDHRRRRRRLH